MALNQLPYVESTIQVVHSGPTDGAAFTTTLDASDGAPAVPTQVFTFDLNTFAPDLIGERALIGVFEEATGDKVEVDITVEDELITVAFFEPVDPTEYRIKVIG